MVVHPSSHRVSRVLRYSGYSLRTSNFAYGILTLYDVLSHTLRLSSMLRATVQTPEILLPPVWPLPRSLATTYGISVDFSSSPYLDVSVQAVPRIALWIHAMLTEYCSAGFPHSEICGSRDMCSSPQLIAACHVLRRLPVPRHSPCALCSLTFRIIWANFAFFEVYTSVYSARSTILSLFLASCSICHVLLFSLVIRFSRSSGSLCEPYKFASQTCRDSQRTILNI